jgi:hypothetical protein
MLPFSEVLINQLNDLEVSFKVLAKRLPEASELLESLGRPVPQELIQELANSAEQFEEIKREVLKLSESVAGLPPTSELGSIRDLRSFMESVSNVIEIQTAHRNIQQAASGVLEKVLSIIHVDGVEFAPLLQCQEKARGLRSSIAETVWPNMHPDAEALAGGQHIFAEFVKLVSFHDRLEDEEWGRLQELVNHSLGKPLGLAASRGKLTISTAAPPIAQAPVSVAQQATATGPREEIVPTEKMATGRVPAAPIEDQGEDFHRGEISAPVDPTTDLPSPMPPVTGGEGVTERDNIEVSRGPAHEPVGLSSSMGATSTDQLPYSPAPGSSGIVTMVATFQSTLDDVSKTVALGLIDNKGIAKALSSNINAASNAAAGGDKKTAENMLIELKNEVQNLPAASWRAVALSLPYSGTISVDLTVERGNPLDVFLTTPDQLDNLRTGQRNQVRVYSDFTASKAKIYKRSGQLRQGNYYLVLRDTSLGVLSASSSDIAVKALLNP